MNEKLSENEEFAPEYTIEEKRNFFLSGLVIGSLLFAIMKFWAIPKLREFAEIAHRVQVFGFQGTEVLLYGIFLGIPLIVFLSIIPLCIQGYKTLRDKQFPHKGAKVFKKTKIVRGKSAVVKGWVLLLLFPIMLVVITYFSFSSLNAILH